MKLNRPQREVKVNDGRDNRPLWLVAAVFVVIAASVEAASGQECAGCAVFADLKAPVSTNEWSFTKQVNEVNVLFVVVHKGKFIGDLSQNDITVRDDEKAPAAMLGFRTERDLPLRVGLLVDTSSSLTPRFRFEKAAASAFLRQAVDSAGGDLGFVMGFSNDAKLMQDFTSNPDFLSQGVQRLKVDGGTAMYDGVRTGCRKLLRHPEHDMVARVLVVLSDGQNNAGTLNLDGAIEAAQQAEVTIYAVSTNYPTGPDGDLFAEEGNKNLRKLAEQTGGRVFFPYNPKEVAKAFSKIGEELRSRYAVSYRPADFTQDGRYRKIKIEAHKTGEKLEIRARKGYFAKAADASLEARVHGNELAGQ